MSTAMIAHISHKPEADMTADLSSTMKLVDIGFNFTSSAFRKDADAVIERAKLAGVTHFVITGSDIEESEQAARLATKYANMVSTAGVHPHLAKKWQEDSYISLKKLTQYRQVVAIGEAGLDYNRNYSTPTQQRLAFEAQLELAAELEMPVFLHERDAHEDFAKILTRYRSQLSKVVVHCFTGSHEELETYIELDCHIGITGWICDQRRGYHLHDSIKNIAANRLMIETDAPYLLPKDLPKGIYPKPDGRRNEPAYLPHILSTVAKCRNASVEQTAQETTQTAKDFFSIRQETAHEIY